MSAYRYVWICMYSQKKADRDRESVWVRQREAVFEGPTETPAVKRKLIAVESTGQMEQESESESGREKGGLRERAPCVIRTQQGKWRSERERERERERNKA